MLLTCSSCNSRYLVNSADLRPTGRIVRCAICGNEWVQEPNLVEEEDLESSISSTSQEKNNKSKQEKSLVSNLPSTYVKEEKPSIINSILLILFIVVFIMFYWFINIEYMGIIALLQFYIQEFYFNLKLIINDLAKLIHQIIN